MYIIQQALTRSPYKRQLLEAQKAWLVRSNDFQKLIQKPFREIFDKIPRAKVATNKALQRLQSFVRGNVIRKTIQRGIGVRKDIQSRMSARIGIILGDYNIARKHSSVQSCPILIKILADWMGQIATMTVYDVAFGESRVVRLPIPFTPWMETGLPRKLRLEVSWRRIFSLQAQNIVSHQGDDDSQVSHSDSVGSLKEKKKNHKKRRHSVGKKKRHVENKSLFHQTNEDEEHLNHDDESVTEEIFIDRIELTFKFIDDINEAFVEKKYILVLSENPPAEKLIQSYNSALLKQPSQGLLSSSQTGNNSHGSIRPEVTESVKIMKFQMSTNDLNSSLSYDNAAPLQERSRGLIPEYEMSKVNTNDVDSTSVKVGLATNRSKANSLATIDSRKQSLPILYKGSSIIKNLYVDHPEEDRHVHSNLLGHELTRFGMKFRQSYFFVRLVNEKYITQVTFYELKSNMFYIFLVQREYIDRSINVERKCTKLLNMIFSQQILQEYLYPPYGTRVHTNGDSSPTKSFSDIPGNRAPKGRNFFHYHNKNVWFQELGNREGLQFMISNEDHMPMIGHIFEFLPGQAPRVLTSEVEKEMNKSHVGTHASGLLIDSDVDDAQSVQSNLTEGSIQPEFVEIKFANSLEVEKLRRSNSIHTHKLEELLVENEEHLKEFQDHFITTLQEEIVPGFRERTKSVEQQLPVEPETAVELVSEIQPIVAESATLENPNPENQNVSPALYVDTETSLESTAAISPLSVDNIVQTPFSVNIPKTVEPSAIESSEIVSAIIETKEPIDYEPYLEDAVESLIIFPVVEEDTSYCCEAGILDVAAEVFAREVVTCSLNETIELLSLRIAEDESQLFENRVKLYSYLLSTTTEIVEHSVLNETLDSICTHLSYLWCAEENVLDEIVAEVVGEESFGISERLCEINTNSFMESSDIENSVANRVNFLLSHTIVWNTVVDSIDELVLGLLSEEIWEFGIEEYCAIQEQLYQEELARIRYERLVKYTVTHCLDNLMHCVLLNSQDVNIPEELTEEDMKSSMTSLLLQPPKFFKIRSDILKSRKNVRNTLTPIVVQHNKNYFGSKTTTSLPTALEQIQQRLGRKITLSHTTSILSSQAGNDKKLLEDDNHSVSSNSSLLKNRVQDRRQENIKKQPFASSVSTVYGLDLTSPLNLSSFQQKMGTFAFQGAFPPSPDGSQSITSGHSSGAYDSAEKLKEALQSDDSSLQSMYSIETICNIHNLHKQPSLIYDYQHDTKKKKVLFSSTFNPIVESTVETKNSDQKASAAAKSLSSTSWTNGKFSIEKSIIESTALRAASPSSNSSTTNLISSPSSPLKKRKQGDANTSLVDPSAELGEDQRSVAAHHEDQDDGLYIQSVKQVQRLGYVPTADMAGGKKKRPWAYAAHWQRIISDFLTSHAVGYLDGIPSQAIEYHDKSEHQKVLPAYLRNKRPPFWELKKKLKTLHRAILSSSSVIPSTNVSALPNAGGSRSGSRQGERDKSKSNDSGGDATEVRSSNGLFSVEEMICALAQTNGSVGEVLSRLQDHNLEFISEIQLVCHALNVKAMVCALPGGAELFMPEVLHSLGNSKTSSDSSVVTKLPPISNSPSRSKESGDENDMDVQSTTNHSTSTSVVSGAHSTPLLLTRPETLPSLRDHHGHHSHLVYPHLHLNQESSYVRKRASFIPLLKTLSNSSETMSAKGGTMYDANTNPSFHPFSSFSSTDGSSLLNHDQTLSDAQISDFVSHAAQLVTGASTTSNQSLSIPFNDGTLGLGEDSFSTTLSQTSPGSVSSQSIAYSLANRGMKKSFRVHKQLIEDLYGQHQIQQPYLAVMSRRDALKVQQEERLLKSDKVYIREHIEQKLQKKNS